MTQPPPRQFSGIFISYRREDSAGHTGRLYDRLSAHFGPDHVFMDIDQIEPGEDFVQIIEDAVGSCEILITVIGRRWLSAGDETSRRLDNPNDFVRLEVAAALRRGIRVIPVLVQGAVMPGQPDLPDELAGLSRRHALELSDLRWKRDVEQLIGAVERIRSRQQEARRAEAQAEEARREAERLRARAEEAERIRAWAREVERAEQIEEAERAKQPEPAAAGAEPHKRDDEAAPRASLPAGDAGLPAEAVSRDYIAAPPPVSPGEATAVGESEASGETTRRSALAKLMPMSRLGVADILVACVVLAVGLWAALAWRPAVSSPAANPFTAGQSATSSPKTITNGVRIEFIWIPPGSFMMGSEVGDSDEKPNHEVTIGKGFYMGKYEVTQAQWQAVMGMNPSRYKDCENCPVESVSWDMVKAFISKLNEMRDGYEYRLPTEAEWEYAARAGTTGEYAGDLDAMAWYGNNSGLSQLDAAAIWRTDKSNYDARLVKNGNQPHPVGGKRPNAFGLFDTHGNVWELCKDNYFENYEDAPTDGSARTGAADTNVRVMRGGSWRSEAMNARSAHRGRSSGAHNHVGLRLVATARP